MSQIEIPSHAYVELRRLDYVTLLQHIINVKLSDVADLGYVSFVFKDKVSVVSKHGEVTHFDDLLDAAAYVLRRYW